MLTLLRVRRVARLQRQPQLDGASHPLRRAGSWQPSIFFWAIRDFTNPVAQASNLQTTNLGVRSSNLFGARQRYQKLIGILALAERLMLLQGYTSRYTIALALAREATATG